MTESRAALAMPLAVRGSSFSSLNAAACQRFIAELRSFPHLLHHLRHLLHCMQFIHSVGVVHNDLKPHNLLLRVVDSTETHVTESQLVIADFDVSVVFPIDSRTGEVKWNETQKAGKATIGWGPEMYHSSVTVDQVDAVLLRDGQLTYINTEKQRRHLLTTSTLKQHQERVKQLKQLVVRDCYCEYLRHHPLASTAFDVFSMGLIFLSLLYRCSLSVDVCVWVKHQMVDCHTRTGTHCSPGHVLLYHDVRTSTTSTTVTMAINDRLNLAITDGHFVQRHAEVIQQVQSGEFPRTLCTLILSMLVENPTERPTVRQCVSQVEQIMRR